jgi:hypothetical protein
MYQHRIATIYLIMESTLDMKHGHEQIVDFEKLMFEILAREGIHPKNWTRWSDNCYGQYKSCFVVFDLLNCQKAISPNLEQVTYNFFESNEGKNLSDTLGSIGKAAFRRSSWRTTDGVVDLEQIRTRMENGLCKKDGRIGNFSFFHILTVPPTTRCDIKPYVKIQGISKVHCLRRRADGTVLNLRFPCGDCTTSFLCLACASLPGKSFEDASNTGAKSSCEII